MEASPLQEDEIELFIDELWLPARHEMTAMREYRLAEDVRQQGLTRQQSRFSDDDFATYLVRHGRELLGYVTVEVRTPTPFFEQVRECHITELFVREDARRQGVAVELLGTAEEWGRARDCEHLDLYVDEGNRAAKALYEERGYAVKRHNMKKRLEDGSWRRVE
ncbi:GNAT family N-acetyltransferase [Halalkalicoccus salilacus]|uniref:GNAT family N-acetyltransferase n=1 Tax=Halalkalicoccus salilacus TaxID=3117459 RepID=UPI00300F665A